MKLTRRQLTAAVSATAIAAAAPPTPQTNAPNDELKAARDRLKASLDQVAQQKVPMAVEPAFQFKA